MAVPGLSRLGRGTGLVSVLGVCLLAALLLGLAIPRFIAALAQVPGSAALRAVQDRRPVTVGELEHLVKSREAAASWTGSGQIRSDLALARLLLLEENERSGLATGGQLQAAVSDLTGSLTRAPANTYAWARLAMARQMTGGMDGKAARALAMSFLTGPREPELIEIRTRLTFDLWPAVSDEDRRLALSHIRFGFIVNPRLIAGLAGDKAARGIIRAALKGAPRQLKKFEGMITPKRR